MTTTHNRLCWNCKTTNEHASDITPGVLCPRCGSQDTRRVRDPKPAEESAKYLKNHCLADLPLKFEEVADLYHSAKLDGAQWTKRLCMSHERLRAEVSGAEVLVKDFNHLVECFRKLREAWFMERLHSHPPERQWEDAQTEKNRQMRNALFKESYDLQTEKLIQGSSEPAISPRCANDVG